MSADKTLKPEFFPEGRKRGEILFSALMTLFGGLLFAALPWRTSWIDNRGLAAQPRLWPALSLGGLIVFAALHFAIRIQATRTPGRWKEGLAWILSLEYIVYYMAYVWSIPLIGYLPATIAFCVLLAFHIGYRGKALWIAFAFAWFVVLVFKTGFNVKIPSGAIYDYAPEATRYTLIRYF